MATAGASEMLQLVMAHLEGAGLVESLACIERESGVPYLRGRYTPQELFRRLQPVPAVIGERATDVTPELDLLTAGKGDFCSVEVRQLGGLHSANITSTRWVDGGLVISGGADRQVRVSRVDGTSLSSSILEAAVLSLDVVEYGTGQHIIAAGCMDGSTSLFRLGADGKAELLRRAKHHIKYNHAVRWNSAGDKQLATASFDQQVHVYSNLASESTELYSPSAAFDPVERLYFQGVVEAIEWTAGGTILAAAVRNDYSLHLFSATGSETTMERRCEVYGPSHSWHSDVNSGAQRRDSTNPQAYRYRIGYCT